MLSSFLNLGSASAIDVQNGLEGFSSSLWKIPFNSLYMGFFLEPMNLGGCVEFRDKEKMLLEINALRVERRV